MNRDTNAGMTELTPEYFVKRWSDPKSCPLIKGQLIDEDGRCCAQGDVMRCAGYSDLRLRSIGSKTADRIVASLLGISLAEAVLLRLVNDEEDGCPKDVFAAPEKVLGPHHRLWTEFARHIDQMSSQDWERVAAAWTAARDAAREEARDAAWAAAWAAAGAAARASARATAGTAAWEAAWEAAGDAAVEEAWAAASNASDEIIGWSKLEEPPFFLRMFFDDPLAWVKSIEEEDGGAA